MVADQFRLSMIQEILHRPPLTQLDDEADSAHNDETDTNGLRDLKDCTTKLVSRRIEEM